MKKRVLSLVCALILTAGLLPAHAAAPRFSDVQEGSWYYDVVMDCAEAGIVNGFPDGTFRPNDSITVVQFCKMAAEAMPISPDYRPYADNSAAVVDREMPDGYWARDLVVECHKRGLDFWPVKEIWNAPITRREMADAIQVLHHTSSLPQIENKGCAIALAQDYHPVLNDFPTENIAFAYTLGVMSGDQNGNFNPNKLATRAQAAAVIQRILHPELRTSHDWDQVQQLYYDKLREWEADPFDAATPEFLANPTLTNGAPVTEEEVRKLLLSYQEQYPEGTPWDENSTYYSMIVRYRLSSACEAFAYLITDGTFGLLPPSWYNDPAQIRVGDYLAIRDYSHAVVVLEVHPDYIVVTEGNYAGTVHWGRKIPMKTLLDDPSFEGITRYPQ